MGGVLQHNKIVFLRDLKDRIHIGGLAGHMNGDNGFCVLVNGGFDGIDVDVERTRIDINQAGMRVQVANHGGGRGEGVGCGDDFISVGDARRFQGQVHGRRARIHSDGMLNAHELRESGLELADLGAGGQPPAAENFGDLVNFLLPDRGPGDRQELCPLPGC